MDGWIGSASTCDDLDVSIKQGLAIFLRLFLFFTFVAFFSFQNDAEGKENRNKRIKRFLKIMHSAVATRQQLFPFRSHEVMHLMRKRKTL